ncbi:MAG: hypothetical protein ISS65_05160 [Desulfobacterales bacterium]|uniref:Uncharacterized protein n=1 Tax=Candidatus Desulfatibia profunda TaxID=2841695 RepID=A0A8J6NJD1_9BACT|nr:hypothetical protein [Candidatus Desulfatibia profunda]MBL7179583.1 hypothetical protein [Desulfobacterales bacterium]
MSPSSVQVISETRLTPFSFRPINGFSCNKLRSPHEFPPFGRGEDNPYAHSDLIAALVMVCLGMILLNNRPAEESGTQAGS